jgi:hypothetical protein
MQRHALFYVVLEDTADLNDRNAELEEADRFSGSHSAMSTHGRAYDA